MSRTQKTTGKSRVACPKNIFRHYAFQTLVKNRTRTLMTIVGIILSVSMITAVTTLVSSLQQYLYRISVQSEGDWHGAVYHIPEDKWKFLDYAEQTDGYVTGEELGYAKAEGCQNEYKPYLFLLGIDEDFAKKMPVEITGGRLPQNAGEIMLPNHLRTNGGVTHQLGDVLTLQIGDRVSEGETLWQENPYQHPDDGVSEELSVKRTAEYTVVGFYERPGFEDHSAPGYTALTVADGSVDCYDVYFKMKKPKDVYEFLEKQFADEASATNWDVLRSLGVSGSQSYNSMLAGLATVLIGIIMAGSISLIYNAFSISVSERTKQFGLIGSIGATRRQMIRCVLHEAMMLCGVGIPLGILAGIGGIAVTLHFTGGMLDDILYGKGISLTLHVSLLSVVIAAAVGLVTVLLSAWLPARRAMKVPAIDAIRQTNDVKVKAKQVKTSKLAYKLFGFEGMIASKNMKRSKKKYRATVISLCMSIVLFISASSFCSYLALSMRSATEILGYDLVYDTQFENEEQAKQDETIAKLEELFLQAPQVTRVSWDSDNYNQVGVEEGAINEEYEKQWTSYYAAQLEREDGRVILDGDFCYINDEDYRAYLEEQHLDADRYMDAQNPTALLYVKHQFYNENEGKYYMLDVLDHPIAHLTLDRQKEFEGQEYMGQENKEGEAAVYVYEDENGKEYRYTKDQVYEQVSVNVGEIVEELPFGVRAWGQVTCLFPYSAIETLEQTKRPVSFQLEAKEHKAAMEKISSLLGEQGFAVDTLYDLAENDEIMRATMLIINIFSYGFIILISLIAAVNVFNTISTNINLRRREFAMLKSVGMSQKGFYRMMRFECLLYGVKGLILGVALAALVTLAIYVSVNEGVSAGFFIPWQSICIAVGSVFAVVFSTMLYSAGKVRKENTVDALKNENY